MGKEGEMGILSMLASFLIVLAGSYVGILQQIR